MASAAPQTVAPAASPTANPSPQSLSSNPAAKKVAVAPPGYKLIKVRKPDGSIVTVKRKLNPDELAATSPAARSSHVTTPNIGSTPEASVVAAGSKSPVATSSTTAVGSQPPSSPAAAKPPLVEAAATSPLQTEVSRAALDEQAMAIREKRMSRFKNGMIRGLANVVAHSFPVVEIGDWHHGDEEVYNGSDDDSDFDNDDDSNFDNDDDSNFDHDDNSSFNRSDDDDSHKHLQLQSGVATNAVAGAMTAPAQHPVAQTRTSQPADKHPGKETYKITEKELGIIEQKAVEDEQPLRRHWANISFYFMASLSIVLPVLFMILGIFIILVNKRSTTSHWRKVEDAVKVAVSTWPIVFAVVVAQVFKAFATFKVERGIKLMRLEQLIGSNSFGNAMKQPLLLRRLDIMTLSLFLVWCLSPLGSQAVQRCWTTIPHIVSYTDTVKYLDTTMPNQMFSWNNKTNTTTNPGRANQLQLISSYYNAAFLPESASDFNRKSIGGQDRYDNPMVPFAPTDVNGTSSLYPSAYGLSVFLPTNWAKDPSNEEAYPSYDQVKFTMNASYYDLNCSSGWKQISNDEFRNFSPSSNYESGFTMTDLSGRFTTHYLAFASKNRVPTTRPPTSPGDNETYSMIECVYHQVTVQLHVDCYRDNTSVAPTCLQSSIVEIDSPNFSLADFSLEFMEYTASGEDASLTSPTERYLTNGTALDDFSPINSSAIFNLSTLVKKKDFQDHFGFAFNTWVTLGFCPECVSAQGIVTNASDYYDNLYRNVTCQHTSSDYYMYKLDITWVVFYWFCCASLLLAGIVSVWLESVTVAPDVMGYASSVVRNSKYLHLPKTNSTMSAGQRLQKLGGMEVMIQDVQANKEIGKIALGMKHDGAQRLQPNRLYR